MRHTTFRSIRTALFTALGITFAIAASAPADAGTRAQCRAYADVSVKQAQMNVNQQCGYKGDIWSKRRGNHYDDCLDLFNAQQIADIKLRRRNMLLRCRDGGSRESGFSPRRRKQCAKYADVSLKQFKMNRRNNCDFGGPIWHGNRKRHINQCLNKYSAREIANIKLERRNMLNECRNIDNGFDIKSVERRANLSDKQRRCLDYANVAVRQNERNVKNDCGYWGLRWHSNRKWHYRACLFLSNAKLASLKSYRADKLRACR